MELKTFEKNKKFHLQANSWGEAQDCDVIKLLDNVIDIFYTNLELENINNRTVNVLHSSEANPSIDYPMMVKGEVNSIYLYVKDRLWSKFSYQFAHELCHHVIDLNFPPTCDSFGWFEESLCELASIFCLDKMAEAWKTNPPYEGWRDYSSCLKEYAEEIKKREEVKIDIPFNDWLSKILPKLYKDRYKRTENSIIALNLYPIFINNPDTWKTIQYLNQIQVTDNMDLESFFDNWATVVPKGLASNIKDIKDIIIGQTAL